MMFNKLFIKEIFKKRRRSNVSRNAYTITCNKDIYDRIKIIAIKHDTNISSIIENVFVYLDDLVSKDVECDIRSFMKGVSDGPKLKEYPTFKQDWSNYYNSLTKQGKKEFKLLIDQLNMIILEIELTTHEFKVAKLRRHVDKLQCMYSLILMRDDFYNKNPMLDLFFENHDLKEYLGEFNKYPPFSIYNGPDNIHDLQEYIDEWYETLEKYRELYKNEIEPKDHRDVLKDIMTDELFHNFQHGDKPYHKGD